MRGNTAIVDDTPSLRNLFLHLQETVLDAVEGCYKIDSHRLFKVLEIDILERLCPNTETGVLTAEGQHVIEGPVMNKAYIEKEVDSALAQALSTSTNATRCSWRLTKFCGRFAEKSLNKVGIRLEIGAPVSVSVVHNRAFRHAKSPGKTCEHSMFLAVSCSLLSSRAVSTTVQPFLPSAMAAARPMPFTVISFCVRRETTLSLTSASTGHDSELLCT